MCNGTYGHAVSVIHMYSIGSFINKSQASASIALFNTFLVTTNLNEKNNAVWLDL